MTQMQQLNIPTVKLTITVLVPAHNEGDQIEDTLKSLRSQSYPPSRIIVIADNCTDDTIQKAKSFPSVEVFVTIKNTKKKAGGLNQWLDTNLNNCKDSDLIMVMDADSILNKKFIDCAVDHINQGYSACGGVFQGKPGGGIVGMFQRNEYARYARDVDRKDGATLVLTGTATVFIVSALKDVVKGRKEKFLPSIDGESHVYDTGALTEDNELTFALLHLDRMIIAPSGCSLTTEVMSTWHDLWHQRQRWKRGAIENNLQYGINKVTAKYWGLQIWGFLGIMVTIMYLSTLTYAIITNNIHIQWIWILITFIYMIERMVTVHKRGLLQTILAGTLIIEMFYDISLQGVHLIAFIDVARKAKKNW